MDLSCPFVELQQSGLFGVAMYPTEPPAVDSVSLDSSLPRQAQPAVESVAAAVAADRAAPAMEVAPWRFGLLRGGLGGVLVFAAVLKATPFVVDGVAADAALRQAALAVFEFAFGAWLLAGWAPRVLWPAAIGLFSLFGGVSAYKVATAQESCGCLGPVAAPPWYTLAFDLAAVGALLLHPPAACAIVRQPSGWRNAAGRLRFAAGISVPIALGLIVNRRGDTIKELSASPLTSAPASPADPAGGMVILKPGEWAGKQFTHFDALEEPDVMGASTSLRRGVWLVFFYHGDCDKCKALLPEYQAFAATRAAAAPRMAFVEVPPFAIRAASRPDYGGDLARLWLRFRPGTDWFMPTPTVMLTRDGVVLRAVVDPPAGSASAAYWRWDADGGG